VRIAVAGIIAQRYGTDWLDGFTHFFEGWVIFITCVALLFLLAWVLLKLQRKQDDPAPRRWIWRPTAWTTQAARIRLVQPSAALITAAGSGWLRIGLPGPARAWRPDVARDSFTSSRAIWATGSRPATAEILAANIVDGLAPTTTIPSSWRARG
jgi:hypothetical protein